MKKKKNNNNDNSNNNSSSSSSNNNNNNNNNNNMKYSLKAVYQYSFHFMIVHSLFYAFIEKCLLFILISSNVF